MEYLEILQKYLKIYPHDTKKIDQNFFNLSNIDFDLLSD